MRALRLLLETQEAARGVAFMLQCKYVGCNIITLPPLYDTAGLRTAIELTRAEFCFDEAPPLERRFINGRGNPPGKINVFGITGPAL